nr:MAG TPA: hypothetical protein [Caudoviricetes sp.]
MVILSETISTNSTSATLDSAYKIFDSLPIVDFKNQIEATNKSNNGNQKFDLQKGVAKLTPVEKAFIDVCLRPLPT